ncbi:MAG TPA: hypothetical protein PLF27_07505 [Sedimentibacter sp.]|nr:hypothetical protein [Sedimentibacter sp.]
MAKSFKQMHLRLDDSTQEQIKKLAKKSGISEAEATRRLIKKGLAIEWADENIDFLTKIIRDQLEIVLKPSVERICSLASKTGHMSATAAFLNVQALMDLVPVERRKDVRPMYENARKKAVEYMRTPTNEWDERKNYE